MELSDLLNQYAIESGEIPEQPVVDEGGLLEQDSSELLEAKIDEITRANDLVESLEALANRYSSMPVSDVSFESYQFTLGHILAVSGIQIPTSVIIPSFESAEKSEGKSFKEKAKGTIQAILKWIKEKFDALLNFFKRKNANTKKENEKASAETKEAEEVFKQLGHEPEGRKGNFTDKPPVKDEEQSKKHGDQNGERKPFPRHEVDKDGNAIGKATRAINGSLPAWMVSDGKFNAEAIRQVLKARSGGMKPLYDWHFPDTGSTDLNAWAGKLWETNVGSHIKGGGSARIEGVNASDIMEMIHLLMSGMKHAESDLQNTERLIERARKAAEKNANNEKYETAREMALEDVKFGGIEMKYSSRYYAVLRTAHRALTNLIIRQKRGVA